MKDTETWNKLAAEIAALMAERDELRERARLLESGAIYAGSVLQSRDDAEKAIYDYCGNDCYRDACTGDAGYSVCPLARTSSKPEEKPLTMDELHQLDGEPVYAVDGEGHECWVLVNVKDKCCADKEFGSWPFEFYNMKDADKLHRMGWLAYREVNNAEI